MRRQWLVWCAIVLHTLWAILLLASDEPLGVTAISELRPLALAPQTLSIVMFCVAGLAVFGISHRSQPGPLEIACLLPQQTALFAAAIGASRAILSGHFADGVPRSAEFLLADQGIVLLLAYWHAAAIIDYLAYRGGWGRPAWTHP